ncbi:MAG: 1-deoxy-D-xylulose-5-phosphate synthase [Oscillospiraceae bacterium]|jgi:1-deoxy-D-xylulose-5-phosphate synthase|nr:1-deoxy-D-xylulose-5-phosphate synthase [Oscillospiraceae bacterium]
MKNFLDKIESPNDLKKLDKKNLTHLCKEIRQNIIEIVSKNGGHLASNLGVVELTVAMHYVFDSPKDKIVLDVGHQCYAHKMLTGRRDSIKNIRKSGGISGFPKCDESIHDAFGTGHSSTSISAALGILEAKKLHGRSGHVIALIGDGALSGGLSYEAINNVGRIKENFIVILNDNKMSISESVGSMAYYLSQIRVRYPYIKTKIIVKQILKKIPFVGENAKNFLLNAKTNLRKFIYHKNFFEDMGFTYYGHVDGHDLNGLIRVLCVAKQVNGPVLIHVNTQKGRGYFFAENDPDLFHGMPKFDARTGQEISTGESFSSVFGEEICKFAKKDSRICVITAAMKSGTGLEKFSNKFPERFFDVGIAESHAVTFAAGLAIEGMLPVFAVYSSFLQRSYDQIIHDAAIQNLKIVIAIDRAGVVGEDGKTHQGVFDSSFLSTIPNVTIFAPSFFEELKNMLKISLYNCEGVVAIRYPKKSQWYKPKDFLGSCGCEPFDVWGDLNCKIFVIVYGRLFSLACLAREKLSKKGVEICIIKLNTIKPAPKSLIKILGEKEDLLVFFFEEGMLRGGVGEHIGLLLLQENSGIKFHLKGVGDEFVEQASVNESLKKLEIDEDGMIASILSCL